MDTTQELGLTLIIVYLLIKEVLGPLVKHVLRKKANEPVDAHKVDGEKCPIGVDVRVTALEVNLSNLSARVVDFPRLLADQERRADETATVTDNKLDLVLQSIDELKAEMSTAHLKMAERMTRVEAIIEHVLKQPPGKRSQG